MAYVRRATPAVLMAAQPVDPLPNFVCRASPLSRGALKAHRLRA